ncbi:MAG: TRAP transporter substrate-binding protein [Thermodesulfobacteriota bacterium]|nr:TRAP transporter substrate-binding protein [Thermodesulfobacteriota bacterium]
MKKYQILALILVMAMFIAAPVATGKEPTYVLKISHDSPGGKHPRQIAAEEFAKLVMERTKGDIKVEVYPAAQLFHDKAVIAAVGKGTVQMAMPGTWFLGIVSNTLYMTGLPMFLGAEREKYYQIFDGKIGEAAFKEMEKVGIKGLAFWDVSMACYATRKKPVYHPDDFKGLKMRVPGGWTTETRLTLMGAPPVSIPYAEVFMALKQGVIDGVESTIMSLAEIKAWEVIKNLTLTNHNLAQFVVIINKEYFDKLPPTHQRIIERTIAEITPGQREYATALEKESLKKLEEHGVKIIALTDKQRAAFYEKLQPMEAETMTKFKLDKALVEEARRILQK